MKVYIDGQYYSKEAAKVSVFDHGFLYGDGVFEGIRVYNGRIFRLTEHIARLYASATGIQLEIPVPPDRLSQLVVETVRENGLSDGYIRLIVSRGPGDLGLDPRKCPAPSIVIIADTIELYPKEYYESGIEIMTCATRRNRPDALNPGLKSLNYLNNIIAKIEVTNAGLLEGLMLNSDGYVSECTGDNIFYVSRGSLCTPPPASGILNGITRQAVLGIAEAMSIPVRQELCTQQDLYASDECFLTGTGAEMIPVVAIDRRRVGEGMPGPVTKRLMGRFREIVATEGIPVHSE